MDNLFQTTISLAIILAAFWLTIKLITYFHYRNAGTIMGEIIKE